MLNVESFAFVLALDEEVIERGIGHRYQAYNFAGKKPEMPITGFEYLEKIVHIPFRLPALSSVDAMSYIRLLEAGLLKSNKEVTPPSDGPWFAGWMLNVARGHKSEFDIKNGEDVNFSDGNPTDENLRRTTTLVTRDFNLTHFVLYCFDAYVPRKLVRLVELFYQIERIAITRQRRFSKQLGGEMDIRIIATLLMLQLFQPELYRAIKRSGTGLGEILRAFQHADGLKNPVSNMDLLRWASFEAKDKLPATTLKSAMIRIGQLTDDPGQRHPALQVRLPIVACLMEHRQAHRHAFDPMKMFQILTESIKQVPLQGGDITEFDAKRYFGLFSKNWDTADTMLGLASSTRTNEMSKTYERDIDSSPESKPTSPVEVFTQIQEIVLQDVNALFLLMVKDDTSAKAIMQTTGLKRGQKIEKKASGELYSQLERWLLSGLVPEHDLDNGEEVLRRQRVLVGNLTILMPYLDVRDRSQFWPLVKPSLNPNDKTVKYPPKLRAQYYDVRAALGQDTRFEGKYALAKRVKGDADEAPPGFVKIEGGKFQIGSNKDKDNPTDYVSLKPFYISRYLVTVAQFDVFRQSNEFKEWSKSRPEKIRSETPDWSEQLANSYRTVVKVNWFEATAYAQWLQLRLEAGDLVVAVRKGYKLCLPDEKQWEVAARGGLVDKNYPWGNEVTGIDQRANVEQRVGHASTVGSYAGNPDNDQALYDMAGNVWEWQSNNYSETEPYPSLRGGSWDGGWNQARCSLRNRFYPDDFYYLLSYGFRLVLSQADISTLKPDLSGFTYPVALRHPSK